jgi:hypothetical protein
VITTQVSSSSKPLPLTFAESKQNLCAPSFLPPPLLSSFADAFKAFLSCLSARTGIELPYLTLTLTLLNLWSSSAPSAIPSLPRLIADFQTYHDRSTSPFAFSLFESTREERRAGSHGGGGGEHEWMSGEEVERLGQEMELDARSLGRLHALCLKMATSCKGGGGGKWEEEDEDGGGVRNL